MAPRRGRSDVVTGVLICSQRRPRIHGGGTATASLSICVSMACQARVVAVVRCQHAQAGEQRAAAAPQPRSGALSRRAAMSAAALGAWTVRNACKLPYSEFRSTTCSAFRYQPAFSAGELQRYCSREGGRQGAVAGGRAREGGGPGALAESATPHCADTHCVRRHRALLPHPPRRLVLPRPQPRRQRPKLRLQRRRRRRSRLQASLMPLRRAATAKPPRWRPRARRRSHRRRPRPVPAARRSKPGPCCTCVCGARPLPPLLMCRTTRLERAACMRVFYDECSYRERVDAD